MSAIELRAKISSHHNSHPLAKQRTDFLAVNADTPLENKAHFTHEVVGAAAAYEAFKAFERDGAHGADGTKVTHARAKETCRGEEVAIQYVLPYSTKLTCIASEKDKAKFVALAQADAARDAKRAVRESGMYEAHELESIEREEKHGSKVF
ncbi:uncharacterized protein L203_100785 [Cryptococcus depauperatus CBS 7841]|uniref:Uncharacterized protein n=1 Tax=Cryptococcus depauperatus CBS 7841 TaxID=1295531 RepID=A0AAJ8LZH6_9TREE